MKSQISNLEFQISKSPLLAGKFLNLFSSRFFSSRFFAPLRLCGIFVFLALAVSAQTNDLQKIADGGHAEKWLISNGFPAEIDAGTWENFNRFNIERLPEKDWLAPFGGVANVKLQTGTQKAIVQNQDLNNRKSQISNPKSDAPLPEVGAASDAKILPDATEISWREIAQVNASIDFYNLFGGKQIGTAYAAARINSAKDETRFIETDGFLGAIWLNGAKIYDGFKLNAPRKIAANFRAGANVLLVRATGISGDYWRKNGGFAALVRFWKTEDAVNKSIETAISGSNQNGTIFYLEGFHVDPVYLHDQRGYSKITLSNTNQYVQSLRADLRYGVYLSEIDYLKPYLDTHPEDREFLRKAVAEGRVGTGGAYNQFNELTIGGESIVRNILYGQAMHRAMLGKSAKSLALWDVFGHAPQISQIAAKSGFNGIAWSKKIAGFNPFFYDYALDGSKLLHRRVDYAYSFSGFGSGKNYTIDNFRQTTARKFAETNSFNSSVDLRINAADFTPPWTNLAGNVEKLESNKPQIRVTGQAQDLYFDALNKEIESGKTKPPVTSRDKLFFHVGVMAARSDLKVAQRLAENMTLTAEKFGTIAYLRGARYPDLALDKAWRQIFFGSHHDAITGTPSDSAFLDLVHGYREAFELSKDALDDSLDFIAKQVNIKPKFQLVNPKAQIIPIVIFNSANWMRSDVVRINLNFPQPMFNYTLSDENGVAVSFRQLQAELAHTRENNADYFEQTGAQLEFVAKDVPSLGYKTFYLRKSDESRVALEPAILNFIENEFYKITVDANKGGAISSIYDKTAKREIVNTNNNHFANEIAALREELTKKNVVYPAWEFWTTGEKRFSTEKAAKVNSEVSGVGQTLRVEGEFANGQKFVQTIRLHNGVKRIDFQTELVDYAGKDELFTVNFPLNLTNGALVTEDRFGTVVRNNSKGFLDFRTNTDKLVSGAPVYAVNNWAEYGSVLSLNFVDASGKTLASVPFKPAALVRPHGDVYEKVTETVVANLIKRGVSVTPFYDDNDQTRRAKLTIEDSTMPRALNDDIAYHNFRIAVGGERENLYSAELLKQVSADARRKFDERLARDNFAYLFLRDKNVPAGWQAMPVLLVAGNVEKAFENLLAPVGKGEFALNVAAESLADASDLPQVADYGVALINNGTPAVSLEKPDTLTLFLTHTAAFPGVNLPFEFVPEHKTHVFKYALYPHEKDWRAADTVKVGEGFNNPLIAVQTGVHDGDLPNEKSFVEANQSNVVLTSMKMGGNPQAVFKDEYGKNNGLRPVMIRFYESKGINTEARLSFNAPNYLYLAPKNLLEAADGTLLSGHSFKNSGVTYDNVKFDANSIRTFGLHPSSNNLSNYNQVRPTILGATKEIVQPIFSRYWLHNAGAAPIGNDAVKVALRAVEQMGELSTFAFDDKYNQGGTTTVAVRVSVVNNYQDRNYKGTVKLEVPEDWRVVPNHLDFDIQPLGSFVKDVVVVGFPVKKDLEFERASGLVKARIEHDGQTFQDVLNLGKPLNLEWQIEKTANGVAIKIRNPHRQAIEGAVSLITPPEIWALSEPQFAREQGFSVAARGEVTLNFSGIPAANWAIARIAYNGNVEYKRADGEK